MSWLQFEQITVKDPDGKFVCTAQINYKPDGRTELINIQGNYPKAGDIATGQDSGLTAPLYIVEYNNLVRDTIDPFTVGMNSTGVGGYLTLDNGVLLSVEEHFQGGDSYDYRDDYLLVLG